MRKLIALICPIVLTLAPLAHAQAPITAADAIQKIQRRYAPAPPAKTVDTIKAGDPGTPVTGIATTFLDTMDVLREAARRNENLIITHEPTFYNHLDDTSFFKDDPVYKEKLAFIGQHHMVVFRLHDEIHMARPDPFGMALVEALGATEYLDDPSNPGLLTIPTMSLREVVSEIQSRLHAQTMRIVGDPEMPVTHIALRPGASGLQAQVSALRQANVDVLIAGEASEWETVEYARDATAQGRKKALVLIGHEPSEEPGMEQAAKDIRALFPGVKVDHILANQSMWSPGHAPAK
ncbi:Nif3-like dinuclear metal center hexameric protein [Edaphobacter modestus]|uniref:Putative NIF3 family GTP cyclohydrolase 1 type 2 n=1 Tax=Edaphobacter modestus TaxID=388466 RepID=A0A4Q7YUD6_9BACT|nr:Nif3-like dinuclear metal center hexameric protein [Edaphobacter modestus]RZU41218.1 putative NIF3 family GTP cyclohydrolase 1 type 2 [Edaphobacter modestus]